MSKRNTGVVFALAGAVTLFFSFLVFGLRAHASGLEMGEAQSQEDHEIPEGKEGYSILGFQAFWKDGIHLQGPREKIKVRIGGSAKLDAGRLDGDDQIGRAFTDFIGQDAILRSLRLNLLTTFYDTVEWKLEFDFANPAQIKENWFGLTSEIPYLGFLRAGYMKEPFSLEILTSSTDLVFMEASLPVWTFAPGSNLGVRAQNSAWEGRVNWAAGGFWNVQPTDRLGDASDRIDQSNGFDLTFRLYGLPWYEGEGGKLLHLGVGYNHRFVSNGELRYKTRPETYLTDNALVDTKEFSVDRIDLFNLEAAAVFGPLSYQGEVFYSLPAGGAGGTHHFWGGYILGSIFLTGEHRPYKQSEGVFSRIEPKHDFRPLRGGWGAWELTARFSYVDCNSKEIRGGEEGNLTLGLNGYLSRHLQVMLNWIRARVKDRDTHPRVETGEADIYQARFQIAF